MKNNQLILASASPRRVQLLEQAGIIPDMVLPADIDETRHKNEKPQELARRLACEKASVIARKNKDCFVLGADTVVACGQRILEKPADKAEAKKFLHLLSGRRHLVIGGMALNRPDGSQISRVVKTTVQFKPLSEIEIDTYLVTREWEGKAGGYGIQGCAEMFVKFIRGSYSNVVGLSLYDTINLLTGSGYHNN